MVAVLGVERVGRGFFWCVCLCKWSSLASHSMAWWKWNGMEKPCVYFLVLKGYS